MAKGKDEKEPVVDEALEGEAPPPRKKKKLLIIIAAVALLILVGGGTVGYLFMAPAEEGEQVHEEAAAEEEVPIYEKLETFTDRLADMESYLQVDISLKVADGDVQGKIKTYMPEVRDALLRLLSSKTAEELSGAEGKDRLADEIQAQINQTLGVANPAEGVKGVLFTSFIIQ